MLRKTNLNEVGSQLSEPVVARGVQKTEVAPMLLKLSDILHVTFFFFFFFLLSRKYVVEGLQLLLVPNSIVDCLFLRLTG